MKQEEFLDYLIEGQYYQGSWRLVNDEELAGSLAAAERLTRLQEIAVPPDFTRRLEVSIRSHARSHNRSPQNGRNVAHAHHRRSPKNAHHTPPRRAWIPILGVAAIVLLAFAGLLTASAYSLPGSSLYGLKQAENQFRLTFATDSQSRASTQMEFLQSALVDLSTEVNDRHNDTAIKLALQIVASRTNDSREAVAALSAGSERDAAQQDLNRILAQEEQTVRHLLTQVDWPTRVLFTRQLGVLGDQVPIVTSGLVNAQPGGMLLITLKGAHFDLEARLIIDGQPKGTVSESSTGQLVVFVKSSDLSPNASSHSFGVLNPDGTAAQIVLRKDDDNDAPGGTYNQYGAPDNDNDADDRQEDGFSGQHFGEISLASSVNGGF